MTNKEKIDSTTNDFQAMVSLLAIYSEVSNRLAEMAAGANESYLEIVDESLREYSSLQAKLTETEGALESLCSGHPEWFAVKKSCKTPYGTVKFHRSTKLSVANEEATILLLEREAEKNPEFKLESYIKTERKLNLELLEKLDDAALKKLRITRLEEENFGVTPAKVDMGKAVEAAATKEAA